MRNWNKEQLDDLFSKAVNLRVSQRAYIDLRKDEDKLSKQAAGQAVRSAGHDLDGSLWDLMRSGQNTSPYDKNVVRDLVSACVMLRKTQFRHLEAAILEGEEAAKAAGYEVGQAATNLDEAISRFDDNVKSLKPSDNSDFNV